MFIYFAKLYKLNIIKLVYDKVLVFGKIEIIIL
jgi:hypothetical protein